MNNKGNKAEKKQQTVSSDEEDEDFEAKDDDIDMMDESDKERFNQMSEKEREIEIFKRLEQREINKTREQIKRKLEMAAGKQETSGKRKKRKISEDSDNGQTGAGEKAGPGKASSDEEEGAGDELREKAETSDEEDDAAIEGRSSRKKSGAVKTEMTGDEDEEAINREYHKPSELANKQNKKKAMADLLNKRRDKKEAEERRMKEAQKAALDLDEIFGNDDNEDGKSLSSSSFSASSSRSSSPASKFRSPSPVAQPIQNLSDLVKCQVIRRRLARIVHAPFFAKTIIGCFVRVQIGSNDGRPTYRIAQVVDVVETAKIYEVEPGSEVRTNKGFKLKICNNDTQRVIRLEFVSNGPFTENEYAFWLKRMQETDTPLPTLDFVERKQKEVQDGLSYKFTDAEINLMVKEKQRFKRNPTNFAFQKSELLKQKEDADQNGDTERVRDLQQQINDLEEKAKKIEYQRTKYLNAVTAINQRNRDHMKQIFLSTERMTANEDNKVKDDDPFTRKSARMKLVTGITRTKPTGGGGDIASTTGAASLSTIGTPPLNSNRIGASISLPTLCNDLFSAHGIDINIDLNKVLPATSTTSFRAPPIASTSGSHAARAPQKSNSTRTLTLEDYKKKYSQRLTPTANEPSA